MKRPAPPGFDTPETFAARLGMTAQTVRRGIHRGTIPAVRVPSDTGRWLIPSGVVARLLTPAESAALAKDITGDAR